MLLTWIAEVAAEPLVLEPADRRVEWETNTWTLGAADEDRSSLAVAEVVAAFERTAAAIRERIRDLSFSGVATFYVWHDKQAGQLRCSTGSVPPDALPFSGAYVPSCPLNNPSVAAEPLRGLDPLAGDAVADAALSEPSAQAVVVVALVGGQLRRAAATGSAGRTNGRDATHER